MLMTLVGAFEPNRRPKLESYDDRTFCPACIGWDLCKITYEPPQKHGKNTWRVVPAAVERQRCSHLRVRDTNFSSAPNWTNGATEPAGDTQGGIQIRAARNGC